ncbi:hypothetical protein QLQ85_08835 [Halomonas sp. M4R5S39]|uniref:hypothetical protein n=1 Tax=Halomonas kalidii TaxID=3043293 RepID=UPI0024A83B31|nr:hypothetical protein [Halomonas kalidii]MDI5984895.1 hypothetical protein [Halomonas kalidii]
MATFSPSSAAVRLMRNAQGFHKDDGSKPAWEVSGASLVAASDLVAVVGAAVAKVPAGTAVTLPALVAGTDYTLYLASDGSTQAVDADNAAPANTRKVGGFHASAGAAEIVPASLWDLNYKPAAPSPRGMVLSLDGRTWADIYLCDVNYALNGYSRNGQTIANGDSLPVIPDAFGGDGATTYTTASWWSFNDILSTAGKRFPSYQEFTALAYGVVERQDVASDPVTTQHQAGHRSACGVEQATGVMWQWGAEISGTSATGAVGWNDQADGRGDIYTHSIRTALLGGPYGSGTRPGSRASSWNAGPEGSANSFSARGVCDHLNLQAES